MTNHKQALIDLRDKVKAGDHRFGMFQKPLDSAENPHTPEYARQAYIGSLDAAKALHEEVLPGWTWVWAGYGQGHVTPREGKYSRLAKSAECEGNPARAWLLAILEALIAKEDRTND